MLLELPISRLIFQSGDANVSGTLGLADPTRPPFLDSLKKVLATHRARRQYREVIFALFYCILICILLFYMLLLCFVHYIKDLCLYLDVNFSSTNITH